MKKSMLLVVGLCLVQSYGLMASESDESDKRTLGDVSNTAIDTVQEALGSFSLLDALRNGNDMMFELLRIAATKYKDDEFTRNVTHGTLGLCLMYSILKRSVSKALIVLLSGLTVYSYAQYLTECEHSIDLQNQLAVLTAALNTRAQEGAVPGSDGV